MIAKEKLRKIAGVSLAAIILPLVGFRLAYPPVIEVRFNGPYVTEGKISEPRFISGDGAVRTGRSAFSLAVMYLQADEIRDLNSLLELDELQEVRCPSADDVGIGGGRYFFVIGSGHQITLSETALRGGCEGTEAVQKGNKMYESEIARLSGILTRLGY